MSKTLFPPRTAKADIELGGVFQPKFDADGLIPCITTDHLTHEVLMFAYMNAESLAHTIRTRRAAYWSRSRGKLWVKGEESGHIQIVKELRMDCDQDVVLLRVENVGGAACHNGFRSCFYRRLAEGATPGEADTLRLDTIAQPVFDPKSVYKK